jgi:hypothetical protein
VLDDASRTAAEAAALRECAADFAWRKDWRDGDLLLYALDHGMAAPAAAPVEAVEKARWIGEMLADPELLMALRGA